MKLSAFRTRIVVGALLVATLALVLVIATMRTTLSVLGRPPTPLGDEAHRACRANPEVWRDLRVGPVQIRAMASSVGIESPPDLRVGESIDRDVGANRRQYITRHAVDGPCSWSSVEIGPPRGIQNQLAIALASGAFLAVLAVGLATNAFTVTPLLRRIERIRGAAVEVGTARYRSENDQIGDSLAQIAAVLDTSHERILSDREELVARHLALEKYMAELAHDLRVPLASLLLALQEVEAAHPEARDASRRALQDANYVSALVENLHQAARLRHGLDPMEGEVDLRDVVSRLEVRFAAVGRVEGVEVAASVPDQPVRVRCTPALAERALGNLLHNAVTHGGDHVAVILTIEGDGFEVVVIDDGEGMSDDERADLSRRTFTQDPARPRGPGLGVAITNEIARRAGWTIHYGAGADGGLEVRITGALA